MAAYSIGSIQYDRFGWTPSLSGTGSFCFVGRSVVRRSFTGFYWVLPGFTGILASFTEFLLGLPSFTGLYRALLGFTGILVSFTEIFLT